MISVEDIRVTAAVSTFVPAQDLEATAFIVIARDKANFPRMPMTMRHHREPIDYWVFTVTLPGTDRVWQMSVAHREVELDMESRTSSPLHHYFERWRWDVVQLLANITLRQHGIPAEGIPSP